MQLSFQRSNLRSMRTLVSVLWVPFLISGIDAQSSDLSDPPLAANFSAQAVFVHHPQATETYIPQAPIVERMVDQGLGQLWGTPSTREGWRQRITPSDTIGLRIHSSTGKTSGSRPAVVAAIIQSLINAGHPAGQIIVWDRQLSSLRAAGYLSLRDRFGVRVLGARDLGYDGDASYESPLIGTLIWGDHEFGEKGEGKGRRSFVSSLITQQISKIVNIVPLLNHNRAGVNGCLFGLAMASVDNTLRFQVEPSRLAVAIPEINALPDLGDRVILNVVDALIAQYQGETQGRLQDSVVLNQLRFSTDPVALDCLSLEALTDLRRLKGIDPGPDYRELYENASLLELGVSDLSSIRVTHSSNP